MMRNLKVLGLALVAVFAMSAVAASMASADDLTSEVSPVTLTGKQAGAGDTFTTTAGTVKCKEVKYTATAVTPTTAVSATPNYPVKIKNAEGKEEQNCTGFGFPAEVVTNGCTFLFKINGAGSTAGTLDVVCPGANEITVTAASGGTTKCVVHVAGQTGKGPLTYTNTGAGTTREVDVKAAITNNLIYKHTAGTGLGACTSGSSVTGSYAGEGIITGEKDNGGFEHVGIFLS